MVSVVLLCCFSIILYLTLDLFHVTPKVDLAHRVLVDPQEVAVLKARKVFPVLQASLASLDRRERLVLQDSQ